MPCYEPRNDPSSSVYEDPRHNSPLAALLCEAVRLLATTRGMHKASPALKQWWEEHKQRDLEKEIEKRKQLRDRKIDPVERVFESLLAKGNADVNALFPASDAQDLNNGAQFIPGEVTDARRRGEKVHFDRVNHYWTMPDGRKVGR